MKTAKLTTGQIWVLSCAAVPMIVFGGLGGWGTYTNIMSVFDRSATALGVVVAGEGATLVLALVMVGLTMLGQPSPKMVRLGLWALPMAASGVSAYVAKSDTEKIVFGITPLAMVVSAEGLGLLARRIVVYTTGVDMEAQRRNAETMQKLSYQVARSKNHPGKWTRAFSTRKSWRLARKAGHGDVNLGFSLVEVQRERMTQGADAALMDMFGLGTVSVPELETGQDVSQDTGTEDNMVETVSLDNETETVSLDKDTQPEDSKPKVVRPRTGQKRSARDFFRDKLVQDAEMVVRDAWDTAKREFDPEISEANARKAFNRARADLELN